MILVLSASKDTYVTDRIVNGTRCNAANLGRAGTLDLFKIYGNTSTTSASVVTPDNELSRVLVKFDIEPLREEIAAGRAPSSFYARMVLKSVFGGQTLPRDFKLSVLPMSRTFDEGYGRDVSSYQDADTCNFLTATFVSGAPSIWFASGANSIGALGSSVIDAYDRANLQDGNGTSSVESSQTFEDGDEDLNVDVSRILSATIANQVPDHGFRVSFTGSQEGDTSTRFVKRFSSRHAHDASRRPKIVVSWDDSTLDDAPAPVFSRPNVFTYKNIVRGKHENFLSSSLDVTGSNSVILRLTTRVSGGTYTKYVTGSQESRFGNFVTGSYVATATIDLTTALREQLAKSGSVTFEHVWQPFDGSIPFATGTTLYFTEQTNAPVPPPKDIVFSLNGIQDELSVSSEDSCVAKCHVWYPSDPYHVPRRTPRRAVTLLYRDVHYRIRDAHSNEIVVPFDFVRNTTRMSNDAYEYYFVVPTSVLLVGHIYVIDVAIKNNVGTWTYADISERFRVVK